MLTKKKQKGKSVFYDKRMRCQKLVPGDFVLVKRKGSSSTYKIDDKWEENPYKVVEQCRNDKMKLIPVFKLFEVVKEGTPHKKTLHRNMLYPYQSIVEADTPLLVKCNQLMDIYFSER